MAPPKRNLENEKRVQEGRHGKQMAEAACVGVGVKNYSMSGLQQGDSESLQRD